MKNKNEASQDEIKPPSIYLMVNYSIHIKDNFRKEKILLTGSVE